MLKHVLMCIGAMALSLIPYRPAQAATFDVCTLAELTAAITTANSNSQPDIINFTCSTTLNFTSEVTIEIDGGNGVTINANGHTVVFDGGGSTRLFGVIITSLTLNNLVFQNGSVGGLSGGGAIASNSGTVIVNNSTFINNSAHLGGAIYGGTIEINNSTFTNNSATNGGAVHDTNTLIINNSTFTNNSVSNHGGVIYTGNATITDSTFTNNTSSFAGGAIRNESQVQIINSVFTGNSATMNGGALSLADPSVTTISNSLFINNNSPIGGAIRNNNIVNTANTHYENNTCEGAGTYTDNGGNTNTNATGCPGDPPVDLDVSALSCSGDTAIFEIFAGDANFDITGTGNSLPIPNAGVGLYGLSGPGTWTDVTITERRGERESINLGGIVCPEAIIIPPSDPPAPVALSPDPFALGCTLTTDVDVAGAPDDTYCRILMRNGGVVNFAGAVPDSLIGLGVKLAVDVYRLDGGQSVVDFGGYSRVCLSGTGRLFYLDARGTPRGVVELATESIGGATCGWIPAAGTLVLTN